MPYSKRGRRRSRPPAQTHGGLIGGNPYRARPGDGDERGCLSYSGALEDSLPSRWYRWAVPFGALASMLQAVGAVR
jgi:hypothetical protein